MRVILALVMGAFFIAGFMAAMFAIAGSGIPTKPVQPVSPARCEFMEISLGRVVLYPFGCRYYFSEDGARLGSSIAARDAG